MESGGAHGRVGGFGLPVLRSVAASRVARARWLLATTSLVGAALLAPEGFEPAQAACVNVAAAFTNPSGATIACVVVNDQTFTGNIVNAGKITPGSVDGIIIENGSSITGQISNSGTISDTAAGNAILIDGSIVTNGITNSGTINSGPTAAIEISASSFGGGIANSGRITSTAAYGIKIVSTTNFSGGITNSSSGTITAQANGLEINIISTFTGGINNAGMITSSNQGGIHISSVAQFGNSSTGGGITNSGTISVHSTGIYLNDVTTFLGGIANTGSISAGGNGIEVQDSANFAGGITNAGSISSSNSKGIFITDDISFLGGLTNTGSISAHNTAIEVIDTSSFAGGITNTGSITGTAGIEVVDSGPISVFDSGYIDGTGGTAVNLANNNAGDINTFTLGPGFTIVGNVVGEGSDIFQLGGTGSGAFNLATIGAAQQFQGFTTFNVVSGVWNTSGTFGQAQAWNVDGGTLAGTGAFQSINVNNGGTLQPGTPGIAGGKLTVSGSLVFATAATYLVNISPNAASSTSVTGHAALNGTIVLNGTGGTYKVGTTFDVLSATGGISGTFSNVVITGNFGSTKPEISYDDVMITLVPATLTGLLPPGAPLNAVNLAGGIDNFTGSGGTLSSSFQNLFNLPASQLVSSLTQLDGEDATGAERVSFDLMNEFLGLMLDPFVYGRGGDQNNGGGALGFAPDHQASMPPDVALAYANALKAPPTFAQRWTAWGAGFGGSAATNGDPSIGSNNVTASTYGYAAGMDYHYSPDTVLGFALAGGGTNWNLAQGLGTGRSDALQVGLYGVTHEGPGYLAAALAFANNWFTTSRTALGDQLTASFAGQSYAARLEGGYRFAVPSSRGLMGVTPYAAVQAQDFQTPSYSETDLTGGGFGLSYNAMNGTDTRSELGARFDDLTALNAMPVILRAKVAWAHDWVSDPSLNASFASLPGTSFTVFGAPVPHDSALTSAGAQLFFTPNWSFLAKFDGEFASGSQTYAGSGTLRYAW